MGKQKFGKPGVKPPKPMSGSNTKSPTGGRRGIAGDEILKARRLR
jgi:hypothetical protein